MAINTLLVIGNGFDLDLNLKTRYSDFAKSNEWKELFSNTEVIKEIPLLQYLYGKSFIEQWFDIEKSLCEYALIKADGSYVHSMEKDKEGYERLCRTLCNYLKHHVYNSSHQIRNTTAGRLLTKICSINNYLNCKIATFNYTPIELYASVLGYGNRNPDIIYLHGNIDDDSTILGIENVDINRIASGYSFLYKSNNIHYKPNHFFADIMEANNVIIFGHSSFDFDFGYFDEYFRMLAEKNDDKRTLTIITLNDRTKTDILDNLRRHQISVLSIYQLSNVEFILTSNLNKKDSEDSLKFQQLLERI